MCDKDHFLQMFRYDHWANREFLAALRTSSPGTEKVLRLLAHILSAQKLWLERLRQVPQSVVVWPNSTVDECLALAGELLPAWTTYLNRLAPADFQQVIDYRNTKGEPWSNRVDDILNHVVMHSAYHRGQAALEMRAAGLHPASTDFIHGVRQGHVG